LDLLHDPRYLAPAATCAAIAVTITLWILNLRRKELSYRILADTPLVSIKEEVKDKVQITFRGEPVHDVHLVQVRIVNSGNVPIRSADYEGRLTIAAPDGSRIVMAEIQETHPPHLEKRTLCDGAPSSLVDKVEGHEVMLKPVLLNHGDSITVKMLVSKAAGPWNVIGHIEGIAAVKMHRENSSMPLVMANCGTFIMVVSMFFLDPSSVARNAWREYLPYLMFFLIGYIMLMCGIYLPRVQKSSA